MLKSVPSSLSGHVTSLPEDEDKSIVLRGSCSGVKLGSKIDIPWSDSCVWPQSTEEIALSPSKMVRQSSSICDSVRKSMATQSMKLTELALNT